MDQQQFDNDGEMPDLLYALGLLLRQRNQQQTEDMEIQSARRTLESIPEGDRDHAAMLNNLSNMLQSRYKRTGSTADLDEAIQMSRQAVESMPNDDPYYLACQDNLRNKLIQRYASTEDLASLDDAVRVVRHALELTPDDHPDRPVRLHKLEEALYMRFNQTDSLIDLDADIQVTRQLLEALTEDSANHTACMNNLGRKLALRYAQSNAMSDLSEAIGLVRQALDATPEGDPDRASRMSNLGIMLGLHSQRGGDSSDPDEALRMARQAADSIPEGHSHRSARLISLADRLYQRYQQRGENVADLDESIRVSYQALDSMSEDYPLWISRLSELGIKLGLRYRRMGDMHDLNESIRVTRQAVEATPEDASGLRVRMNHLGNQLGERYEATGDMVDLDEAIRVARQLLEITPEDHPDHATCLNNLGIKLEKQYERTKDTSGLDEAIRAARTALASTPTDHPLYGAYSDNFGNKLEKRYERTRDAADLDEAIRVVREGLKLMPQDHPDRGGSLNNLANKLGLRYDLKGDIADIDEAIRLARQAVDSVSDDHINRASWLHNLGFKLQSRSERTGDMENLESASACYMQAWNSRVAIPFHRIKAAARCLKLLAIQFKVDTMFQEEASGDPQEKIKDAIVLGKEAIDLLPTVNTRLLERSDQQYVVSTFAGVAADLCAFLIVSNRSEEALEYLEKGRAVILSQLIDGRSDVFNLAQLHPELSSKYQELRDEVNTPLSSLDQAAEREQALKRRGKATEELAACIDEIRGIPGHEQFLLGQTTAAMQECAAGGSIVIVNITEFWSDAILVSPTAIKTMSLPELSSANARVWLGKEWSGRRDRGKKNKEYLKYLEWLWQSGVKQILDEVHADHASAVQGPPRVWWIGSGFASAMPFHAAGIHVEDSTETAFHRATSSYAPSIKALAHAQKRAKDAERTQGSLMVVTMPTTPSSQSLPGVAMEKDLVLEVTRGHVQPEEMEHPDTDRVLEGLQRCCIAHFACHGTTDYADPSSSGLMLQKGVGTGRGGGAALVQDRLTVRRMSELDLRNVRLAYLSACSTAQNKAENLADEDIHVVSGFQVAGFPHVVGCLWPSVDSVCVEVASQFYRSLFNQGESRWKSGEIAAAFREAVMAIRDDEMLMGLPLNWAQFVHYGP